MKEDIISALKKYGNVKRENIDLPSKRDLKVHQKFQHCFVKFKTINEAMNVNLLIIQGC